MNASRLSAGAVAGAVIFVGVSAQILGFATDGASLDPTTFEITLNRDQWVLITAGGFAIAVVAALAIIGLKSRPKKG